ncbi:hypothetical protein VNO80_25390 [Phaseolus coccineus]|uniref:Uncharacterized protein n=1 Tax=Phaseolus coccineus TaxID=3886 RepID=A0AAN9QTB6_PHACN
MESDLVMANKTGVKSCQRFLLHKPHLIWKNDQEFVVEKYFICLDNRLAQSEPSIHGSNVYHTLLKNVWSSSHHVM